MVPVLDSLTIAELARISPFPKLTFETDDLPAWSHGNARAQPPDAEFTAVRLITAAVADLGTNEVLDTICTVRTRPGASWLPPRVSSKRLGVSAESLPAAPAENDPLTSMTTLVFAGLNRQIPPWLSSGTIAWFATGSPDTKLSVETVGTRGEQS